MTTEDVLPIWTIYDNPSDYPGKYVLRRSVAARGFVITDPVCYVSDTLDAARKMLPPGLFRLDRQPGDEVQIVETWL